MKRNHFNKGEKQFTFFRVFIFFMKTKTEEVKKAYHFTLFLMRQGLDALHLLIQNFSYQDFIRNAHSYIRTQSPQIRHCVLTYAIIFAMVVSQLSYVHANDVPEQPADPITQEPIAEEEPQEETPKDVDKAKDEQPVDTDVPVEDVTTSQEPTAIKEPQEAIKMIVSFKNFKEDGLTVYKEIEVEKGTLETDLGLPISIIALYEDGSEEEIEVTWKCIDDSFGKAEYDAENTNATYTYEAVLPEGYELVNGTVILPYINVTLKDEKEEPKVEARATTSTTVKDYDELAAAIADTNITEITVEGTVLVLDTFDIQRDLKIKGADANAMLKRPSQDFNLFTIQSSATLSLENIIIDGDNILTRSSCIEVADGTLHMLNGAIIQNNNIKLYVDSDIKKSTVRLSSSTSNLIMENGSKIINNKKESGEGTAIRMEAGSSVIINGGEISNNSTKKRGGAIYNLKGNLQINGGLFAGNELKNDTSAGGFLFNSGGNTTITGGQFLNNTARGNSTDGGGAIYNQGYMENPDNYTYANLTISGGYFSGNIATNSKYNGVSRGGAIYNGSIATNFYMSGGIIDSSNSADLGSGIFYSAQAASTGNFELSGNPTINSSIYVYNHNGSDAVQLTLSASITNPIMIEPSDYDTTGAYPIIKASDGYTITKDDISKIKIKSKITSDGIIAYYPKLQNKDVILTQDRPEYIKDTVYVDGKDGNDVTGDGSKENPYETIEKGVENTAPGGTVIIDGTVTIDDTVIIEAPEDVYGSGGVTIKPSDKCKIGEISCTEGAIIVGPDGELIFGPIHIDENTTITVEPGGSLTTSDNTDIPQSFIMQPQNANVFVDDPVSLYADVVNLSGYTYTYQWYSNSSDSTTGGTPIAEATDKEYRVDTSTKGNKFYYCIITATKTSSGSTESLTSDVANIKVIENKIDSVTTSDETDVGKHDGKLLNVDDTMEYKLSTDTEYTKVSSGTTEVTGLAPGTYTVRYIGTSISKEVIIKECPFSFSEPTITVGDSTSGKKYTYGLTNEASISFKNTMSTSVDITNISITDENNVFTSKTATASVDGNGTKELVFRVKDYQDVGTYSADVAITYTDKKGTSHTVEQSLKVTIDQKGVTANLKEGANLNKTYDGTTDITLTNEMLVITGLVNSDDVSLQIKDAKYDGATVGERTVTATLSMTGVKAGNYKLSNTAYEHEAKINKAEVEIALNSKAISKEYDGNTAIALDDSYFVVTGLAAGSDAKVSATGTYASKNGGTGINVTVDKFVISDTTNYSVKTASLSATGSIMKKEITVVAKNPVTKVYDGGSAARVAKDVNYELQGVLNGENISIGNYRSGFDSETVGENKTVTISKMMITSDDDGTLNYVLKSPTLTIPGCSITKKPVSIVLKDGNPITKAYDGTTSITVSPDALTVKGLLAFHTSSVGVSIGSASFDSAEIGNNRKVTLRNLALNGTDASNYELESTEVELDGKISASVLTVSLKDSKSIKKVYDGTAELSLGNDYFKVSGLQTGHENITISATATFDNKNVGTDKIVTITNFTISGDDAYIYSLSDSLSLSGAGDITAKELSLEKGTAITKTYDGTKKASVTANNYSIKNSVKGDKVDITYTASFNSENVKTADKVSLTEITLTGSDAGNYVLVTPDLELDGKITPKEASITWSNLDNYTYNYEDQSNTIMASYTDVNSEVVTVSYSFGNGVIFKNAGEYSAKVTSVEDNYIFTNETKVFKIETIIISDSMLSGIDSSYEYTGKAIAPEPIMKNGERTLTKDKDYTVTHEDNINKGFATINIRGIGNYMGVFDYKFAISYANYDGKVLPDEGRNKAGYYKENITLEIPKGFQISLDDKTYMDALVLDKETVEQELQYFLKDDSGKIYSGSETYSLDKTAPVISGIEKDKTYYLDQTATITETNIKSITLNGNVLGSIDTISIPGNVNKEYTLMVVDKADNEVLIAFHMKSISSLIPNIKIDTVKDGDQATIEDTEKKLNDLLKDVTNEEHEKEINKHLSDLQALKDKIQEVKDRITNVHDELDKIDTVHLNKSDQAALEDIMKETDELTKSNNLTDIQRSDLNEVSKLVYECLQKIKDINKKYDEAKDVIDQITKDNVKSDDKEDVQGAVDDLDDLKQNENLDSSQVTEVDDLLTKGQEVLDTIKDIEDKLDDIKQVEDISKDTVEKDDQSKIDEVKDTIKDLEENYSNNLNDKQNQTVLDHKDHVDELDKTLEDVEILEEKINGLKDSDLSDDEITASEKVILEYLKLSDHQKEIMDLELNKKINDIITLVGLAKLEDKQSGVFVEGMDNLFMPSTTLKVDIVTNQLSETIMEHVNLQLKINEDILEIYDIQLMMNGEAIQPNGNVKVTIPLNESQKKYSKLRLVYIDEQGVMNEIPFTREGDSITFVVNHFSYYALLGEEVISHVENEGQNEPAVGGIHTGDNNYMSGYMMALLVSTGVMAVFYWKQHEYAFAEAPDCFKGYRNKLKFAKFLMQQFARDIKEHYGIKRNK